MRQLFEEPMQYAVLVDDATGVHTLDVLCGGIAMYAVTVVLSPGEVAAFQRDPRALAGLAEQTARLGRAPR
jgi:hypothetical protein